MGGVKLDLNLGGRCHLSRNSALAGGRRRRSRRRRRRAFRTGVGVGVFLVGRGLVVRRRLHHQLGLDDYRLDRMRRVPRTGLLRDSRQGRLRVKPVTMMSTRGSHFADPTGSGTRPVRRRLRRWRRDPIGVLGTHDLGGWPYQREKHREKD